MNKLINGDCVEVIKDFHDLSVDTVLTDIPYGVITRQDNGLRNLDKGKADVFTFDLKKFLNEVDRITKGTIIIFCGVEQLSVIFSYFYEKQKEKKGTVRQIVWHKTNPSPMNGEYVYLSSVENAVWFRKKGGTFNARCKHNVLEFPCGKHEYHPTQKNEKLFETLILDNTKENEIVLDPCMGSGTTGIVCRKTNRSFIGIELDKQYYEIAKNRIEESKIQGSLFNYRTVKK